MLLVFSLLDGAAAPASPLEIFQGRASLPAFKNVTIRITSGDCFEYDFLCLAADGSPIAFSSPSATFELFDTFNAALGTSALLVKTPTMTQVAGVWKIQASFISADTLSLPPKMRFFQIKVIDGINSYGVATGWIENTPNLIG